MSVYSFALITLIVCVLAAGYPRLTRDHTSTEKPYQYREDIPVQRPVPLALHHEVGGQDPGVSVPGVIG